VSSPTTINNVGVAMFTVSDQDAAIEFYTGKLGFELRGDVTFGENDEMRWVEVAPPGSTARIALNPPMMDEPGGGAIGVESLEVEKEFERLKAIGGIEMDEQVMSTPGAPVMFRLSDPDGNHIWVVRPDTP
jgi:lactoylglutathione lyase